MEETRGEDREVYWFEDGEKKREEGRGRREGVWREGEGVETKRGDKDISWNTNEEKEGKRRE